MLTMVMMWNEIMEQPAVMARCFEKNKNTVAEIVKQAKNQNIKLIYIAARGTSDHAAVYARYVFEITMGIPVALAAPSVFTVYGRQPDLSNALVIGISQSGKAADVLEVLKAANRQGALTVSITNFEDSPMAAEAKYHLFCDAGLEKSVAATKTFTSQIYLLARLAAEWTNDNKLHGELSALPGQMAKALEIADIIKEKAERYRYMEHCFVLSRGVNYSIALEAALKIQETTYVKAKAYATSDFYHGPFAMIERNVPVILFAPEGPTLPYGKEMALKLADAGAELVVVSNNRELLDMGRSSFEIPYTDNDIISPFFNVAVAQMFACRLALARSLDPDKPRSLSKVTITK